MQAEVLIVDDDDSIRETVAAVLAEEGYLVATAPSGTAALIVIARHLPAVILLDMRMPAWTGSGRCPGPRGPGTPVADRWS